MKPILLLLSNILCCHVVIAQSYTTIKTPTNVTINALLYSELSPGELAYVDSVAANWISANGSGAVKVADASATYNCHGYAWHIKDGGNIVWINAHSDTDDDPEELSPYWSGSSPTYTSTTASDATVAFYGSCWSGGVNVCDHSARVISPTLFESKWGVWPRYQHAPADCPFNSSNIQYYKIPLTGSYFACPSQTYATLNIAGASYSWSGSNVSISGSSYAASPSSTAGGTTGSIQVNIASSYSGTTINATKNVWAGGPASPTSLVVMMGPSENELCRNQPMGIAVGNTNNTTAQGVTQYNWDFGSWASDFSYYDHTPLTQARAYLQLTSGSASSQSISVYAQNSCGNSSAYTRTFYAVNCGGFRMTYPNPATDMLTLSFDKSKPVKLPDQIDLINEDSQKSVNRLAKLDISEALSKGDILQIPVKNFARGVYYLHLTHNDDNRIERIRIVLE